MSLMRAVAAVGVMVVGAVMAGCDTGQRGETAALERNLQDLDGMASVDASSKLVNGGLSARLDIVLASDITDDDFVVVLTSIRDAAESSGIEWLETAEITVAGDDDVGWKLEPDLPISASQAAEAVDVHRAVAGLFEPPTTVVIMDAERVIVDSPPDVDPATVFDTAATITDEVDNEWTWWFRFGDLTPPTTFFGGEFTADRLRQWERLSASMALAPSSWESLTVYPSSVEVQLSLPVDGADLTEAAYGAELAPMIDAQLDIVASMPKGTTYEIGNGSPDDVFVSVAVGGRGEPDELDRGWGPVIQGRLDDLTD